MSDKGKEARDARDAIRALNPQSQAGRLRELMPDIEAKVREGVRHDEIVAALGRAGIQVSLPTFRTTLYRWRRSCSEGTKSWIAKTPIEEARDDRGTGGEIAAPNETPNPKPDGPAPLVSPAHSLVELQRRVQAATPNFEDLARRGRAQTK